MRVVLVLALVLAGCTDASSVSEVPEPPEAAPKIHGVVLDPAFVPLEGVRVEAPESSLAAVTDADGAFELDLTGSHTLRFSLAGYVELEAVSGEPPMEIILQPLPTDVPYSIQLHARGYIGCAVKVATFVYPDQCAPIGDGDRSDVLDFQTQEVPEVLQTEIVWGTTQEFGKYLGTMQYLENVAGIRQKVGNVWGESPLVCRVTRDAPCTNPDGSGGGGDGLELTRFPGKFYASVYAACYQQCAPGTAVGAGAIFQQEYDIYATAFFNEAPPADWTLQEDGPYPP